jgi:hypothetical protein
VESDREWSDTSTVQAKEQENERQDCPHLQAVLEDGVQGGAELVQEDATSRRPVAVGRGGVLRKLVHETAHQWHSLGTSPYTTVLPWDYSTQQYSPPPLGLRNTPLAVLWG